MWAVIRHVGSRHNISNIQLGGFERARPIVYYYYTTRDQRVKSDA